MKTYCVKQTLNSHHRWLFAVMAAMAIGVAGCQEDQRTHQDQKQQAQTHWNQVRAKIKRQLAQQQYQSGELEAAISTIRESLGLDPSCVESYVLLGRTLLEKGDLAQAKQTLQAAEALGLSSAELSYAQGMVTERTGELAAAVEHYQQAHRLNPADQDFRRRPGRMPGSGRPAGGSPTNWSSSRWPSLIVTARWTCCWRRFVW